MTAATTTTLPPSVDTFRSLMDDQAKHIGEQRERINLLESALKDFMDKAQLLNCAQDSRFSEQWEIASDNFVASMRRAEAVLSGEAK